ncbi:MAG: hypothetical protein KDD61_18250, partial [Bdellovibrionales bacterium]|nr:hypothetical protein [Bdellovibrionales bacterium]
NFHSFLKFLLMGVASVLMTKGVQALNNNFDFEVVQPDMSQPLVIKSKASLSVAGNRPQSYYEYVIQMNVYMTQVHWYSQEHLKQEFQLVQQALDVCKIKIEVKSVYDLAVPHWMTYWESFEFNEGEVTDWERYFFSKFPESDAGILFVKSIDWTIGTDGTTAVGNAPFAIEKGLLKHSDEHQFYEDHIMGHAVVGKAGRSRWSMAHEIGHAILNLEHHDDPENIMFFSQLRAQNSRFTQQQCDRAIQTSPKIHKKEFGY